MYYLSIACAHKSICIANPYFVPDAIAIDMLIEARRRSADVRHVRGRGMTRLARAPPTASEVSADCSRQTSRFTNSSRTMLHQKTMVVDGLEAVGTTDFDDRFARECRKQRVLPRSRGRWSTEASILLDNLAGCERVTVHRWKARGVGAHSRTGGSICFKSRPDLHRRIVDSRGILV